MKKAVNNPKHPCFNEPVNRIYHGQIRAGQPGQLTTKNYSVFQGLDSGSAFLHPMVKTVYDSEAYRLQVNPDAAAETYFKLHDPMARRHFSAINGHLVRNGVVADIGCGGGSVLDLAHGHSATSIAIEPFRGFHTSLRERKHLAYGSAEEASVEWRGRVNSIWSLHVIEHVADPIAFMNSLSELLQPGGRGLILTPNLDDILLSTCEQTYSPFWFRTVHLWYFNGLGLSRIVEAAGLKVERIRYVHEYGMSNYQHWIAEGKPRGETPWAGVTANMDAEWGRFLESQGKASSVAIEFRKP